MSQYKVPQDVEAEDKIIGPLTLRQFIYAVIGLMWGGLCFVLFRKLIPIMIVVGLPVSLLFLLLAFYRRDGQNFEQLLVAMAGYFGQTRRRLWLKEPIVEAFQIIPPKVTTEVSQRNPAEVRSQLDQLATMMDARGSTATAAAAVEDRLYMPTQPAPQQASEPDRYDVPVAGDPLAQLIEQSVANLRSGAIEQMRKEASAPPSAKPATQTASTTSAMTAAPSGDIIRLATENDDLSVSQIAAQAGRQAAPLAEGESVTLRNVPNQPK